MIITELYNGQGLGNQLWCYVTTRVIALNKGYDFGIQSPERFKGIYFMDLDFGKQVKGGSGPEGGPPVALPEGINNYHNERGIIHTKTGSDVRTRDPDIVNAKDNTKIDGYMQDVDFIEPYKEEIKKWLKVRDEVECYDFSNDDTCVINFRGGTYVYDKDFFLPSDYWQNAISHMRKINKNFRFIVITDDVNTAKKFFPDFEVYHFSISKDYAIIKNAEYLILSNSSFAWFPAWLSEDLKFCIAPKYWGRYNISDGFWSLGYTITKGWNYLGRDNILYNHDLCIKELNTYISKNKNSFTQIKQQAHIKKSVIAKLTERISILETRFRMAAKNASKMRASVEILIFLRDKSLVKSRIIIRRLINDNSGINTPASKKVRIIRKINNGVLRMVKLTFKATGIPSFTTYLNEKKSKRHWLSTNEISAYRKTIKIYDIFTFFNELDLLEIRLNMLDSYVDYFVICEASQTFSGNKKTLYFKENRLRFKKWEHKIIHYVTEHVPTNEDELRSRLYTDKNLDIIDREMIIGALTSDLVPKNANMSFLWAREFYIKESVRKALVHLQDNDVCYLSDLDEFWNPELLIDYSKDDVFKLSQLGYQYYLNNRSNEDPWLGWTGTIVTKYKNIRTIGACVIRAHNKMEGKFTYMKNGGWHFAFQGGVSGAKKKIQEYKYWYSPWENLNNALPGLEERVSKNMDIKGRNIKLWKDERGLPRYILDNREKYKKLFL